MSESGVKEKLKDLEAKLDWLKKKRWALEACIVNMCLYNTIQISSTADESVRERHKKLDEYFKAYIEHAGGISVYTDWDKNDYKELMPCYIKPRERMKSGGDESPSKV